MNYLRKLKEQTGETITETLVSVIIMSLVMVVITGAIVVTARINERARSMTVSYDSSETLAPKDADIKVYGVSVTGEDGKAEKGSILKTAKGEKTEQKHTYNSKYDSDEHEDVSYCFYTAK